MKFTIASYIPLSFATDLITWYRVLSKILWISNKVQVKIFFVLQGSYIQFLFPAQVFKKRFQWIFHIDKQVDTSLDGERYFTLMTVTRFYYMSLVWIQLFFLYSSGMCKPVQSWL